MLQMNSHEERKREDPRRGISPGRDRQPSGHDGGNDRERAVGISLQNCTVNFLLPVLLGNVVGGVALVAAGVHAEFLSESRNKPA